MGTHSLILFQERTSSGDIIKYVVIYQQYDGYLSGVGLELVRFISSKKIVNGYAFGVDNQANGYECLIAQYISSYKKGVGGLYIYPATTELNEDFNYVITYDANGSSFTIKVNDDDEAPIEEYEKKYCEISDDDN
jgi:hypothetical protein